MCRICPASGIATSRRRSPTCRNWLTGWPRGCRLSDSNTRRCSGTRLAVRSSRTSPRDTPTASSAQSCKVRRRLPKSVPRSGSLSGGGKTSGTIRRHSTLCHLRGLQKMRAAPGAIGRSDRDGGVRPLRIETDDPFGDIRCRLHTNGLFRRGDINGRNIRRTSNISLAP